MDNKYKFYLTGSVKIEQETPALKEMASSVIKLPTGKDKQPDLMYMTSILVSTGTNLNNAHFLASELLLAENSIVNKALDIEHEETEIIGHQIQRAYRDKAGNKLDLNELASLETATLDNNDMDIEIASVVYKARFPDIAKEIAAGEYKVSMECYYVDFDVKVGNTILPRATAEALGVDVMNEAIYGKAGRVIKDGKEIASGTVVRVLLGICFSGCGIVKNPANPDSIIIETASDNNVPADTVIFDLDMTKASTEEVVLNNVTSKEVETKEFLQEESTNICTHYKKHLENKENATVMEDWCTMYAHTCTSDSRDSTDQECIGNKSIEVASLYTKELFNKKCTKDATAESLGRLLDSLKRASIFNN